MKPLLAALKATSGIKALAHITGGGFPDNIPRVLPDRVGAELDLDALPVLPVFQWLARTGGVADEEMLRTFNCGIGMIVVCAEKDQVAVSKALRDHGEDPVVFGRLIPDDGNGPRVRYRGKAAF